MSSQPLVQWNYVIYFHIRCSSLTILCTSFRGKKHNSKEIVNMQGLFVLTADSVDMTTYPLTIYYHIIERVYLIYRLFILFISTFSCLLFLYTVSWRHKRLPPCQYRYVVSYYVLYVINTINKHLTLSYHVCTYDTKKVPI